MEKVHAVVARSTFGSKNVAKHVSFGRLLDDAVSKKCTPLWREAHFEVKMWQNTPFSDHFWTLRCRKSARRCGAKHIFSKNVQITACSGHFWTSRCPSRCRKSARHCGAKHISKSKVSKTEGFEPLFDDSNYNNNNNNYYYNYYNNYYY